MNTVASDATSVGQDIVQAASNPETQAVIFTAGVDIGTGAAIGLTGGAILATPVGQAALGAAISSTTYTIASGSHATLSGAAFSAGTGAVIGAATYGVGELFGGGGALATEEGANILADQGGEASNVADTWGNPATLTLHFLDHGADFGAQSEDEYASMAHDFYQQALNKVPTQPWTETYPDGVMTAYDFQTNTFGAYNADGTTQTFFKPVGGPIY